MHSSRVLSLAVSIALAGCSLLTPPKTPTTPPVLDPDLVQRGAILFADSRLSGDGSRACATCHPGGGSDYKVYRDGTLVPPYTEGGRRTLTLRGVWQTAPYLWDDSAPTVAGAVDRMLAIEMLGSSLAGRDREALEAYLLSLTPFDRGRIQPDGAIVEPATFSRRRPSHLRAGLPGVPRAAAIHAAAPRRRGHRRVAVPASVSPSPVRTVTTAAGPISRP